MARDYDKDIDNIQYGKSFAKDPKFSEILSDTSIDSKVTMTNVHKNINSLAGQLEKSQLDFHKQIKGISGSISSTVKQQERLVKQIQMRELASTRDVKVVEKSVQQIMGKLGYTIDILGKSSKKILVDTARTTKETLKQYGQALSADFNINKSNFLAMSLAKASPIFGYFVGKFMETGIFKHFSELIKEKLGMAVTFVGNKIKDLWGRGTTKVKTWYNKRKESKQNQKELPKLQTGGYVTKAGAAKLHAAEVVAPVEKLRDMFTEALQPVTDTVRKIYSFMKWAAVFRTAGKLYRMFKRSKYSSYLSKSKDPQIKLTEDMGLFFSQSMMKYDEMISSLKGKVDDKKGGLKEKFTKESIKETGKSFVDEFGKAFKAELEKPKNMFNKVKGKIGEGKEESKELKKKTINYYNKTLKSFKNSDKATEFQNKTLNKIKKATEGTESRLGLANTAAKKMFSSIGTWLMIGFTLIKGAFGKVLGIIKPIARVLLKIPFKAIGLIFTGLGKIIGFLIKRFPLIAGALSFMTAAKDSIVGAAKAREWHGVKEGEKVSTSQRVTAAIGGALGGTKSGVEGAKSGALKGAGMGMLIGSAIVPGLGTAIGGAIGAIAGGVLGAVGGKNIAVGLQVIWDQVKSIVEGAWTLIKLPFRMMGALASRAKKWLDDSLADIIWDTKTFWGEKIKSFTDYVNEKLSGFLDPIFQVIDPIISFISDKMGWLATTVKSVIGWITNPISGITDLLSSLGKKAENVANTASNVVAGDVKSRKAAISSVEDAGMKWARGYESGGVVPKAPNRGVDGRGGQLALVHEGEKIIPKSVVESSRLNGGPTKDLKMGSSKPGNIVDNILSGLKEMVTPESLDLIKGMGNNISNFGSNIFGKLKIGFENLKENLGPKSGFGWLSRMFESAGAGPAAIGWDSTGGKSYGYYQLAEKRGTPKKFLEQFPKIGQQFTGLQIGSEQFDAKWRELAKSDPSFAQAQHDFIKQQYLNPYLAKIKAATGIDLSTKHSAVLEEILSTAVQYGPNSGVIPKALSGLTQTAKDEEIIKKIGEYKFANVGEHFRSSTSAVQQAVANRISRETSAALQALGISNAEMTAPYGSQPGKTSMFGRLTNFASGIAEKVYSSFKGALGMPANSGLVTSEFGPRNTGLSGASTIHKGIDLRARQGEPVYSIQDGIVTDINNKWGQVSIKHPNGFESSYAHLSEYGVQPGTKIGKGQKIGAAGKTGPIPGMAAHLHMSVKDPTGNYVNPRKLFENAGINLASKDGAKTKEMGSPGPELSKKDVARMQADKDTSMANLLNESSKGFQDAALNSMNQNGKQTAMIVNSMSNNISSSMNSLAKSVAAGGSGGGNNQGNNDISAILSGDMA